jgi:hypothetical protein
MGIPIEQKDLQEKIEQSIHFLKSSINFMLEKLNSRRKEKNSNRLELDSASYKTTGAFTFILNIFYKIPIYF